MWNIFSSLWVSSPQIHSHDCQEFLEFSLWMVVVREWKSCVRRDVYWVFFLAFCLLLGMNWVHVWFHLDDPCKYCDSLSLLRRSRDFWFGIPWVSGWLVFLAKAALWSSLRFLIEVDWWFDEGLQIEAWFVFGIRRSWDGIRLRTMARSYKLYSWRHGSCHFIRLCLLRVSQ